MTEATRDHTRESAAPRAARAHLRDRRAGVGCTLGPRDSTCPRSTSTPHWAGRSAPSAPRLPHVTELEIMRHYAHLADMNFGVDSGLYPLGSCTMKYNPRVNEDACAARRLRRASPVPAGRDGPGRPRADGRARRCARRGLRTSRA